MVYYKLRKKEKPGPQPTTGRCACDFGCKTCDFIRYMKMRHLVDVDNAGDPDYYEKVSINP